MEEQFDGRTQLLQLLRQIHEMKSHALKQSKEIKSETADLIGKLVLATEPPSEGGDKTSPFTLESYVQKMNTDQIAKALILAFDVHGKLSKLIEPATPESLIASRPRKGIERLTSFRLTDWLFVVTVAAIVAFLWGIYLTRDNPDSRWGQVVSYVGASALGASFAGLYCAYKYVASRTFDPVYTPTYLMRLLLGTVSGLILAYFGASFIGGPESTGAGKILAPAAMALVGGYSADAVNLILKRVSETLVAAVRGSGDDAIKAKEAQLEAEAKTSQVQERQMITSELSQLLADTTDEATKERLRKLMAAVGKGEEIAGATIRKDESAGETGEAAKSKGTDESTAGKDETAGKEGEPKDKTPGT